ncbi:MAG: EF-hand domain-containing protein [Hyphomonadaceae bacterium]
MSNRPPKKSESIEVRLPYETKREFLDLCRKDGTTASAVVRDSIERHIDQRRKQMAVMAAVNAANDGAPVGIVPAGEAKTGKLIDMISKPVHKWRYLAGAAGALGLFAGVALPSAARPDLAAVFSKLDRNGDGVLSSDEFLGGGDAKKVIVIRKTDSKDATAAASPATTESYSYWIDHPDSASGDGKVVVEHRQINVIADDDQGDDPSVKVLRAVPDDVRASEFSRYDADKDGKITLQEFSERHREMLTSGFKRLDTDGDGYLSSTEYAKIGGPITLKFDAQAGGKDNLTIIDATPHGSGDASDDTDQRFAELDANGDGKVSLQEYLPKQVR